MAKQITQLPQFTPLRPDMLVPVVDPLLGSQGSGYATLGNIPQVALPGGGRTVSTLSQLIANNVVFNVKDFGAIGDYASHPVGHYYPTLAAAQAVYPTCTSLLDELDMLAIQKAITAAQAVYVAGLTTGGKVYVPSGAYLVNRGLTSTNQHGFALVGDGMSQSAIVATTAMNSVITLGDALGQLVFMRVEGLMVNAAGFATYAIYGARVENSVFINVMARGATATGAGCSIGYGYTNRYIGCKFSYNYGDGFVANTDYLASNNTNLFIGCDALGNSGWGYRLRSGLGIAFYGGDTEQCAKGGIYVTRQVDNLIIDGMYFETVGQTGDVIGGSTIKCGILLNGSGTDSLIDDSSPSHGVRITNCTFSSHGGEDAFVVVVAVDGLTLEGNTDNVAGGSNIPLLKAYANKKVAQVKMGQNANWASPATIFTAPADGYQTSFRLWRDTTVPQVNYAEPDFLRWFLVAGGGGGSTFRRSGTTYRNQPVWEIANGTGVGDIYGFTLNMGNLPELQGRTVMFGAWVAQGDTTVNAVLYANGKNSSLSTTGSVAGWHWIEAAVTLPTTGTVTFGFYGNSMAAGKTVIITEPVLTIVGAGIDSIRETRLSTWFGTAMPAAGSWVLGDRVINRSPAVGQPKAWARTTTGSNNVLGTDWVSEGNL